MPQQVQIGEDIVEFPDGMPQEQIDAIVKRDFSVAGKASQRLSSQSGGLPASWSRGRVFAPEDIKFSEPSQPNGGFLSGFVRGLNPIPAFLQTAKAVSNPAATVPDVVDYLQRIRERGAQPTSADVVGGALSATGLPDPIGTWKESMHRGVSNQSTADMYGGVAGGVASGALIGKVAPAALEASRPAAARMAMRGFNKMIGATPEDLANGGVPGRGVAAVQPSSWGGFSRIGEIAKGLQEARAAKDAFMSSDVNAQFRAFDPEPLIQQAIDSKQGLATTTPALRRALGDFGSRMRAAVANITNGEARPLSAAEMDRLRDSIDANWNMANKQNVVVAQKDLKLGDAAIDMDRAIRRSLEGDQSPIGKQYKALNQRIQDLSGAQTVQSRTNTESLAPQPAPSSETLPRYIYNKAAGAAGKVLFPSPAQNALYNMMGRVGKLNEPLPSPQRPQIVDGLSEPSFSGLTSDPMQPGQRAPEFVGSTDASNTMPVKLQPAIRHSGNIQERAMQAGASQNTLDMLAAMDESRKRSASMTHSALLDMMRPGGANADDAFIAQATKITNPSTGKPYTPQEAQIELAKRKASR